MIEIRCSQGSYPRDSCSGDKSCSRALVRFGLNLIDLTRLLLSVTLLRPSSRTWDVLEQRLIGGVSTLR